LTNETPTDLPRERITELLAAGPLDGMQVSEVTAALGLEPDRRRWVRDQLRKLAAEGQLERNGRRYVLCGAPPAPTDQPDGLVSGRIQLHPSGRGFVNIGEAYEDILIPRGRTGGAMDGDTVEVELGAPRGRRQAGRVSRVLTRGRVRLTGLFRPPTLSPDDPRVVSRVEIAGAVPEGIAAGDAVLATITEYPDSPEQPLRVQVERRLGEPGLLLTEVAKCVAGNGVEEELPADARAEAAATPDSVRAEEHLSERLDLRGLHFVTIDPFTARDFDDAVAVERGPNGAHRVWIAVADVSHYVAEGSALDRAARARGCSIYLPDRAIPMLPHELSSGICSLVPGEDRLAMTVRLDIDDDGKVLDNVVAAAVIHSRGQLDYGGVAAALSGDFSGRRMAYREHSSILDALQRIAAALHRRRLARGSLDLDLPEAQVLLDEDDPNRVRAIAQSRPDAPIKRAYNLIEELMVAANEAVGRLFHRAGCPTIWRVHAPPRPEALESLRAWAASYGLLLRQHGGQTSKALARLVEQLAGHRAARPISYLVLRTLKQATYGVSNIGHFGLGSTAYLHFTSPIRRYPDLHVHRLVKRLLAERGEPCGAPVRVRKTSPGALGEIAAEASALERRAIDVEREVQRVYASSLMREHIGDELWGTISGVSSFGFFVSLDEPFVEGLVKSDGLPRRVKLDPWQLRLIGQGAVYSLGDRVLVRVVDTSVRLRQIDLALVPGEGHHEPDPGYTPREQPDRRERRGERGERYPRARRGGRRDQRRGGKRRGKHGRRR